MTHRLALLGILALTAAAPAPQQTRAFRTPSGNIACMADRYDGRWELRCDILQKEWQGRRPADCDLDAGDALGLNPTGAAYWICHGDTVMDPRHPVLAYGRSWQAGPFTCTSAEAGVTCLNQSRHGFLLSRSTYRVF